MSNTKKDFNKRLKKKTNELNYLVFSFLLKNSYFNNNERYLFFIKFNNLNKFFLIKNHCLLTNNNTSVNRFSNLTRSNFKNLISCGYVNHIKKSTW